MELDLTDRIDRVGRQWRKGPAVPCGDTAGRMTTRTMGFSFVKEEFAVRGRATRTEVMHGIVANRRAGRHPRETPVLMTRFAARWRLRPRRTAQITNVCKPCVAR